MPHVKRLYAERAGIVAPGEKLTAEQDTKFDLCIVGVNHFGRVLQFWLDKWRAKLVRAWPHYQSGP